MAKVFPDWIEVGDDGRLARILEDKSPSLSAQVVNSMSKYRTLTTEGLFTEDDDFSVIMKTIESIDATTGANQRNSQSQRESQ